MLIDFVWSRKRHLLKKQILFQDRNKGGLGLACLQARVLTFRFSFLQRFLNLCSHHAYDFCAYNLRKYKNLGLDFQLFFSVFDSKCLISLPCFYANLIRAWSFSGARIETTSSISHVLNLPLNYFGSVKETLYSPTRLFACGIRLVKQIINFNDGIWIPYCELAGQSVVRCPSLRLLDNELKLLHEAILIKFTTLFHTSGLQTQGKTLQDAARLSTPYLVTGENNTNLLIAPTKAIYLNLNRSVNCLPVRCRTPWHELDILSSTSSIV